MEWVIVSLLVVIVAVLGVLVVRGEAGRSAATRREVDLREALARAEAMQHSDDQQLAAYGHVASSALGAQSQQLLALAETKYGALAEHTSLTLSQHTERIGQALDVLGQRLASLERERSEGVTSLHSMIRELTVAHQATRDETAQLRTALRDSRVRGAWGEVQLRRILELAGMQRHIDFTEQTSTTADGARLRPDAIVHLPNDRCVVVDAKAPLDRFLEAGATEDEQQRRDLYAAHARAVRAHAMQLAARRYSEAVDGSVDMVVMFLPGESFLSAALNADPTLFEHAATNGVVLASPSSLLALLRGVAEGWRERYADEQAAEIQRLGGELHDRISVFLEAYAVVGTRINAAADAYNRSLASAESRLLVTARKLGQAGAPTARQVPTVGEVLSVARTPSLGAAPTGADDHGDRAAPLNLP